MLWKGKNFQIQLYSCFLTIIPTKLEKCKQKRKGDEKNMPLEKPAYRDNLERIISAFPNQELLSKKEVADFCGLHSKTVGKMFPFKGNYISVATLARELS